MEKEIKGTEKMNKNDEIQIIDEESLQSVSGGSFVGKVKGEWQKFMMPEEEKEEMNSLLDSYYGDRERRGKLIYGGSDSFVKRMKNIENKLSVYAEKYPDITDLKAFKKQKSLN